MDAIVISRVKCPRWRRSLWVFDNPTSLVSLVPYWIMFRWYASIVCSVSISYQSLPCIETRQCPQEDPTLKPTIEEIITVSVETDDKSIGDTVPDFRAFLLHQYLSWWVVVLNFYRSSIYITQVAPTLDPTPEPSVQEVIITVSLVWARRQTSSELYMHILTSLHVVFILSCSVRLLWYLCVAGTYTCHHFWAHYWCREFEC